MGIMSWLRGNKPQEQRAITSASWPGIFDSPTRTGVHVSEQTALAQSTVWCAVKVISESIGSLPVVIYSKSPDGGREQLDDHPLALMLDSEPNGECTARVFWETFVSHALLWGNAFAEIQRDGGGRPIALWIVHPRYVQVLRDSDTGQMVYRINLPLFAAGEPGQAGRQIVLSQADVLHVPGLSPDSQVGFNLLKIARENIAFSIALDRFGQAFFGNSARMGGTLTHPGTLSDQARENIRLSWNANYAGIEKTGQTALLEEGLKFEPFKQSNEAGQYDETKQFQGAEICRLFNISPVKCHFLQRATWSNLATLNSDFWDNTCRPWAEKIEAELERKLLAPNERRKVYVEFDADTLTRGAVADRYANYAIGIGSGFLTPDECRAWENLPPLPEPEPVAPPALPPVAPATAPDQQPTDDQATKLPEGTDGN